MIEVTNVVHLMPVQIMWKQDGQELSGLAYLDYQRNIVYPMSASYSVPQKEVFEFLARQRKPSVVPVVPKTDTFDANNYQGP